MENNIQNKEEENHEQNQNEEQENNYEEENGEEEIGEEEANLNFNGEYEGEMEGEEEVQEDNMEEAQNNIEGEEMEINQEKGETNEQQGEEYEQINNQNEDIKENLENEKEIITNNNENNEVNNKNENNINNLKVNNENVKNNLGIKNDININNKLSNLQRIELINNKLNLNLNNLQKKTKQKKENIIENEIEKEQEFNRVNINHRKNDILSELLIKIQDFKQRKENFDNIREKYNSNKILDNLDKEITKGLERLNNKRMMQDNTNIEISTTNKVEKKILRNPKFKEIVTMINDKEGKKYKKYSGLGKNDLLNIVNNKRRNDIFGNINIFSQTPTFSTCFNKACENKSKLTYDLKKAIFNDKNTFIEEKYRILKDLHRNELMNRALGRGIFSCNKYFDDEKRALSIQKRQIFEKFLEDSKEKLVLNLRTKEDFFDDRKKSYFDSQNMITRDYLPVVTDDTKKNELNNALKEIEKYRTGRINKKVESLYKPEIKQRISNQILVDNKMDRILKKARFDYEKPYSYLASNIKKDKVT